MKEREKKRSTMGSGETERREEGRKEREKEEKEREREGSERSRRTRIFG